MVLAAVFMGVVATAFLDLYAVLLKRALSVPAPNYCLVGRWVAGLPAGALVLQGAAKSTPAPRECILGWTVHYVLGVGFALVFLGVAGPGWIARPTLWPALLFGLATVAAPFLILHPALGSGVASSKAPKPNTARARSLAAHAVFGLGLYLAGVAFAIVR